MKKSNWKDNTKYWIFCFHQEVIKAAVLGKKLLKASRTNAHMKETYEELGRLLEKGVDAEEVNWDSPKMRALLHTIKACKKDIEHIENQVHKIKFSSGPKGSEDISHIHPEQRIESEMKKKLF